MDDRDPVRGDPSSRVPMYQPLLRVLLAVASGIALSLWLAIPLLLWSTALLLLSVGWAASFRRRAFGRSGILVLLIVACCGGIWFEYQTSWISPDDIGRLARSRPAPVCLQGVVASSPDWVSAASDPGGFAAKRATRTRFSLKVTAIRDGQEWIPASGRVEVFVDGQSSGLVAGDRISVAGNLNGIAAPGNPGQFDFARFFRARGLVCRLSVAHPDAIEPRDDSSSSLARLPGAIKLQLDELIWRYVSADRAALASAMLLGNREQLNRSQRQQFLLTGTVHLLAISGLHVGILAGLFLILPRIGLVTRRTGLLITVLFVIGYAWLVDFRPPVLRAAILISVYCYCKWAGREAFSFNSLALAGLVVLLVNPADLFSTGAQLSFLAVATLIFCRRWLERPGPSADPVDRLIVRSRSWAGRAGRSVAWHIWQAILVSLVIWLVAMPMVASQFHIVAPIALVINPLLLAPVTVALVSGFCVMIFGWLIPPLAVFWGTVCDVSLYVIQSLVGLGQAIPASHYWTSGPPWPGLVAFYVLLAVAFAGRPRGIDWRLALSAWGLWLVAGWWLPTLISSRAMQDRTSLTCTFVDVGHGSCVLLEFPGGRNVLYDCGSIGSPETGARNASGVLWSRRITHLDAVIISHADSDHFNGFPELARQFGIERVVLSARMWRQRNRPDICQLLGLLQRQGIPLQTVSCGDELPLAGGVRIDVLNPPRDGPRESDNADSIVLDIAFQGRRLLLPGDLEREGLDSLLCRAAHQFDVVMAPHHGSPASRPVEFLRWANPRYVVVSSRRAPTSRHPDRPNPPVNRCGFFIPGAMARSGSSSTTMGE